MKVRAATLLVLVLGALAASVSVASAITPKLVLSDRGGNPIALGTKMVVNLQINGCEDIQEGTLLTNDKATDKIAIETITSELCFASEPPHKIPTGLLGTLKLNWTGTATFQNSRLQTNEEGPCAYNVRALSGVFSLFEEEFPRAEGTAKGLLHLGGSSLNCSLLQTYPFEVKVFYEADVIPNNLAEYHVLG